VAGAVVAVDAAADGADRSTATLSTNERAVPMRLEPSYGVLRDIARTALLVIALTPLAALGAAAAQRTFASPEDAATALVQAVKAHDRAAILAVMGRGSEETLTSGDAAADRAAGDRFVAAYEAKHAFERDGDAKATLTLGPDDWPFAFPLVKTGDQWHFDTDAGKQEILARRVGDNELSAINVMLAIVDAQRDYASADHNKNGVREYARRFASTPGKKDGLYWKTADGEAPSPLGPLAARASREGYQKNDTPQPYHGYYYRILTAQGSNAKGGALDYVVRGYMMGGFGVIAWPAKYGNSGVMTFIVNHDGVVYQKDLGPDTAKLAAAMTRFDPGPGWTAADIK